MRRRKLSVGGGGGICALKVAGIRRGQVVCGWKASWLEAAQQGENVGENIRSGGREGGREEYFVQDLDLCQAWNACKLSEGNGETLRIPAHTGRRDSMLGRMQKRASHRPFYLFSIPHSSSEFKGVIWIRARHLSDSKGGMKACHCFHIVHLPPKQNCRRGEKKNI